MSFGVGANIRGELLIHSDETISMNAIKLYLGFILVLLTFGALLGTWPLTIEEVIVFTFSSFTAITVYTVSGYILSSPEFDIVGKDARRTFYAITGGVFAVLLSTQFVSPNPDAMLDNYSPYLETISIWAVPTYASAETRLYFQNKYKPVTENVSKLIGFVTVGTLLIVHTMWTRLNPSSSPRIAFGLLVVIVIYYVPQRWG